MNVPVKTIHARNVMRTVVATMVVLFAIGWLTSNIELPRDSQSAVQFDVCDVQADSWRRTKNGWEDKNSWQQFESPSCDVGRLHPAIVAALTFVFGVGGLQSFRPRYSVSRDSDRAPCGGNARRSR